VSSSIAEACNELAQVSTVMVLSHVRPDGDAIGSLLGLSRSLQLVGKQVFPVLVDGLPGRYKFLPGSDQVRRKPPNDAQYLITVDCADKGRLGIPESDLPRLVDLNIDHHPTNSYFARHNLVFKDSAATTQILYDISSELELPIDQDVAACLLTGLVTDTIGFRTPNVTPAVLRVAADLQAMSGKLAEIYHFALNQRSLAAARYWGSGLSRLEADNGLIWTELRLSDRREAGYEGADDADLISMLSTITGVDVAMIFVEQAQGKTKVSWRSQGNVDVSQIAAAFGGGGHQPAAGAMVYGDFLAVREQILRATRKSIHKQVEPD